MIQKINPGGVIWGPFFLPQSEFKKGKSAKCTVHLYRSPCIIYMNGVCFDSVTKNIAQKVQ